MPITTPPPLNSKVKAKVDGQIVSATFIKEYNGAAVVEFEGNRVVRQWTRLDLDTPEIPAVGRVEEKPEEYQLPSVERRFEFSELLCDSIVYGDVDSMLITGSPGMGKSRLVIDRMKYHGLGTFDTMTHKGYVTPRGLYELLYNNNNKLIIFDDCDSVFNNETSSNILKAALDTYETRMVSWGASKDSNGIPCEFEFTGRMIAISNYSISQVPEAFTSRSVFVDLTMNLDEKIQRITQIGDKLCPDLKPDEIAECIQLLDRHKKSMKSLNLRTMQMVGKIRKTQPAIWKDMAEYMVLTK